MKCAFLQGDLDEQRADDDNDGDNFKIESAQPVSDTFCEPVPQLSRKLQLKHHQCVRLFKAVSSLVDAPRRWYHRVATDLRNMGGEKFVLEPCLWILRYENGVFHVLCLVYVDDFMLACSDSSLENMSLRALICTKRGKWESREFKQCAAQITQALNKHT